MRAPKTEIQWMLPPLHPMVISEELGEWKKVNKETENWGAYERNAFSEPRVLHLPLRRMLNSLIGCLLFDVQTACPFCCKLMYSLTSPPASLEQFSQTYWNAVSQAQSPKHSHKNKITLRLWLYFLVNSISSSNEYSGLISLKGNWFDHLAVQGTLRSLLQHYSSKAWICQRSTFFMVHLSQPHMTTGKTIDLTIWTFVSWNLIGPTTYTTAIQVLPPSGISLYFFPPRLLSKFKYKLVGLILTFKTLFFWDFHAGNRLKLIHF